MRAPSRARPDPCPPPSTPGPSAGHAHPFTERTNRPTQARSARSANDGFGLTCARSAPQFPPLPTRSAALPCVRPPPAPSVRQKSPKITTRDRPGVCRMRSRRAPTARPSACRSYPPMNTAVPLHAPPFRRPRGAGHARVVDRQPDLRLQRPVPPTRRGARAADHRFPARRGRQIDRDWSIASRPDVRRRSRHQRLLARAAGHPLCRRQGAARVPRFARRHRHQGARHHPRTAQPCGFPPTTSPNC